jgi:lipid A ethanolaminephosphotransferase
VDRSGEEHLQVKRPPAPAGGFNPLTLAALASLWIATLANWPLWRALSALPEMGSMRGGLFIAGFGGMVAALMLALLAFAAWRHTIKPAIVLFVVSAALGAHFMGSYGVVIDPTMMTNVVQTNPRETLDLLSLRFFVSVLLLAGVPLLLLWWVPVQRLRLAAQLGRNAVAVLVSLLVLAALMFALFADLSATMRNHKSMRYLINPVNSFYALGAIAFERQARPSGPPQAIGADVRLLPRPAGAPPPLLLLVVGETARADHFALNGYARPTNPELARHNVISFRDVTSCGTNTAASLPCMFSALGRVGYQARERDQETLLDLAQHAGLAVLWLDNQAGCKGVCGRVPNAFARDVPAGAAPLPATLCADGDCLDEALLHGLDERLAALPAERRARGVLLVLHQMGSHGPAYYKRSPPDRKPFMPECSTNVLQQCEHDALLNAYDNSIAYTDHVLALAIEWLKRQGTTHEPALLYVSDHGESLGENNLYLHGLPYALAPREQTHVPMLVWLAPRATAGTTPEAACLGARRDTALTHDHLFHTVMGLLGLRSAEYRESLDAFAPCRRGSSGGGGG